MNPSIISLQRIFLKLGLNTLKSQVTFFVAVSVSLTVFILTIFNVFWIRSKAIDAGQKKVLSAAGEFSSKITRMINGGMHSSKTLTDFLESLKLNKISYSRENLNAYLQKMLARKEFFGTYSAWEPNAYDENDVNFINKRGSDKTGRMIPYWTRGLEGQLVLEPLVNLDTEDYYMIPKKTHKPVLVEPFLYPVQGKDILMISCIFPIMVKDEFYGIGGIDMEISFLQQFVLTNKEKIFEGKAEISVVSPSGIIAVHTAYPELIGKKLKDIHKSTYKAELESIEIAETEVLDQGDHYVVHLPLFFDYVDKPWQIQIHVPKYLILREAYQAMTYNILLGIVVLVFSISSIFILIQKGTKSIAKVMHSIECISHGDLTEKTYIESNNEIGNVSKSLDRMIDRLRESITMIVGISGELKQGSAEIASVSHIIAEGAIEQAASIEEIHTSLEELLATISSNAQNAIQTERIANDSYESILEGSKTIQASIESIKSISERIKVIDRIARETNTLAMNAAIEAVRAGENGAGFAVVAGEVRKLAKSAQDAAGEIREISNHSLRMASQMESILKTILPKVENTTRLVKEITQTANEQKQGMEQINIAMTQLSDVAQTNSSTSEELSASSATISNQSEELFRSIAFFVLEKKEDRTSELKKRILEKVLKTIEEVDLVNNQIEVKINKLH